MGGGEAVRPAGTRGMKVSIPEGRGATHLIVRVLLQRRVAVLQALVQVMPLQGLHGEPAFADLPARRVILVVSHRDPWL